MALEGVVSRSKCTMSKKCRCGDEAPSSGGLLDGGWPRGGCCGPRGVVVGGADCQEDGRMESMGISRRRLIKGFHWSKLEGDDAVRRQPLLKLRIRTLSFEKEFLEGVVKIDPRVVVSLEESCLPV